VEVDTIAAAGDVAGLSLVVVGGTLANRVEATVVEEQAAVGVTDNIVAGRAGVLVRRLHFQYVAPSLGEQISVDEHFTSTAEGDRFGRHISNNSMERFRRMRRLRRAVHGPPRVTWH
jgi:hypothetical protein